MLPSLLLPGCPNCMCQEVVTRDLLCMGVQVVSFTLKDVSDEVDYLSSLGRCGCNMTNTHMTRLLSTPLRPDIALAARDAAVGVAEETR